MSVGAESSDIATAIDEGRAGPSDIYDPRTQLEVRRAFIWIGMAVMFGLAIFLSSSLLVIFGGVVFAALIDGGARLLGKWLPIQRGARVGIVLLLTFAFFVWMIQFAGNQIATQAAQLPATVQGQALKVINWLSANGIRVNPQSIDTVMQQAMGGIGQVTRAVGGLIGGMTTIFLIVVLGIYFALEPDIYRRGFAWMLPADQRDSFERTAQQMGTALRKLLFGRLLGMGVEGVATWIMLELYGVPMAFLLGLITGLLAALPNIGAPISGAIMILVGFSGGVDMGIFTIFVYAFVQMVDGYVIIPLIARKTVDLAPALVLAAQLIMGVLFGILGLALADPLVAMIKVWLERQADRNQAKQEITPTLASAVPYR